MKSVFTSCQYIMPIMMKNGGGSIVNITSVGGQMGSDRALDYAASKGALITFTKSMARIGSKMGKRVNAVSPGWIDIGIFTQQRLVELQIEAKEIIPLGRMGKPEKVAHSVLFFYQIKPLK